MVMSVESERSRTRTFKKETTSDIIPSLHDRDCEMIQPTNMKILRRATLKIDLYLIPMLAMFCVSHSTSLYFSLLTSPSDLLSFLVSALAIAPLKVSNSSQWFQDRSYVSLR